jgi:hypothetical protein
VPVPNPAFVEHPRVDRRPDGRDLDRNLIARVKDARAAMPLGRSDSSTSMT